MGKREIASSSRPDDAKLVGTPRNDGNVFAVILVGGRGKRLRPLSTDARPKAFLSITRDRRSMFRVTVDRINKIIPQKNIIVSANKAHRALVERDFPKIKKENLILEPVSRNTAGAIGFAALRLKERGRDAVMVVVPADQYVLDENKYLDTIKKAISFAKDGDSLVLLGLKPTYPATGFGYVKVWQGAGEGRKGIYRVKRFVEKPDLETAKRYITDTGYLWNAGAFVFRVDSILWAMSKHAPQIYSVLMRLKNGGDINKLYKDLEDISVDYAVMEEADNIYCVKGAYRWRDVGSFEVLKEVLNRESRNFVERDGKIVKIL